MYKINSWTKDHKSTTGQQVVFNESAPGYRAAYAAVPHGDTIHASEPALLQVPSHTVLCSSLW